MSLMDHLKLLAYSTIVPRVKESAAKYRGRCTWQFSHCMDPVAAIITREAGTAKGICEMLLAKWMDEHAHGRTLVGWLAGGGLPIDGSKIRLLMQQVLIGRTMVPEVMVGGRAGPTDLKNGNIGDVMRAGLATHNDN